MARRKITQWLVNVAWQNGRQSLISWTVHFCFGACVCFIISMLINSLIKCMGSSSTIRDVFYHIHLFSISLVLLGLSEQQQWMHNMYNWINASSRDLFQFNYDILLYFVMIECEQSNWTDNSGTNTDRWTDTHARFLLTTVIPVQISCIGFQFLPHLPNSSVSFFLIAALTVQF